MQPLAWADYTSYLAPRVRDFHKGLAGHVLILGGNIGFSGAVLLAGIAALRVGAGRVSIATHPQHAAFLTIAHPEIMCHGISLATDSLLQALLKKASCLVIGPGLGQCDWADSLWNSVMQSDTPMIVDADALNLLANNPKQKNNWILTPHPGEAARLLNQPIETIQQDRVNAVKALQEKYKGFCILKGANTVISDSQGTIKQCNAGNPGMATAGMGDVLSGVIGGLAAQQLPLAIAANLGVLLHATAGDQAAKKGERGMIASDLMKYLRQLMNPT